ncbi:MAG: hypothetical protein J5736_00160 [Bacilli bacterium]|nr:hypothetical protein [Bacilli bacterium]
MNAKKLLLLGASAMLLASCGESLNRADAIEFMNGISQKKDLTAEKLTYVKEYKEDNEGTKLKGKVTYVFDGFSCSYAADIVDKSEVEAGETVKGTAVISKKDATYTVAVDDGKDKIFFTVADTELVNYNVLNAVAKAGVAKHISTGLGHANKENKYGYCGFLARFPEGEGKMTGGSFRNDAYIKDESYVKTGEGSISCSYNAYYETQGDEVMKAEWKDYFLVAKSNAKTSSSGYGFETWNYGKGSVAAPKTDGYTEVTGGTEKTLYTVAVAAMFGYSVA